MILTHRHTHLLVNSYFLSFFLQIMVFRYFSDVMDYANPIELPVTESPYELLLRAALLIPVSHYLLGISVIFMVFVYNFLEFHFLQDLITGFRGQPVTLTFNPSSQLYRDVVSKCRVLHGRYSSTPWLCSPHLQTAFMHYLGNPPVVNYKRQLFTTSDGGTIALDWVATANEQQSDATPIIIIIPGLSSASDCSYIKHLVSKMAQGGCNVVVTNHRGIGGVPITSDCFYTGAWAEDLRSIINHIHSKYPEAPLFAVGTSIGANILVKYLGEDGLNVPIIGGAAICSPWDSLLCDRFIRRNLVQRLYGKFLIAGMKDFANLHKGVLTRLTNWEAVKEASSLRDFDDAVTRVLANDETVDAYYRRCSSCNYVGSVKVPLLCISYLDDPICTSEAIPWDECRLNKNVVLATTQHGGHLPFFEGLTARSIWWVRAVDEFFGALKSNPLRHHKPQSIVADKGNVQEQQNMKRDIVKLPDINRSSEPDINVILGPVKRCLNEVSSQNQKSMWLLAYIAVITSWPVVGSMLTGFLKKKFQYIISGNSPM